MPSGTVREEGSGIANRLIATAPCGSGGPEGQGQGQPWPWLLVDQGKHTMSEDLDDTDDVEHMSEEELRGIKEFANLPVYDEDDERADRITLVQSSGGCFTSIHEKSTLDEVRQALKNPKLVPIGGLRVEAPDGSFIVRAYFGEKRP
jgi:hypothetical protein